MGLPVVNPSDELALLLWGLFEAYEEVLQLKELVDHHTCFPANNDEVVFPICIAIIESSPLTHAHSGDLRLRRIRKVPETINIPINIQLPPGIDPQHLPAALQQVLSQLHSQIPVLVRQQVALQSPVSEIKAIYERGQWRDITQTGD